MNKNVCTKFKNTSLTLEKCTKANNTITIHYTTQYKENTYNSNNMTNNNSNRKEKKKIYVPILCIWAQQT